jgi:nicotinate-nucleotide adenylyltransferase
MQIGLFFGSFNPIHIGHLALANYIVENSALQQIWFVVSPQNPFKDKKSLLNENLRYDLVYETIKNDERFGVSNIEFSMPKPSYTSNTLVAFAEKFPLHQFSIIMGEDNLQSLHKWKNADFIQNNYSIYVYPRLNVKVENLIQNQNIIHVNAPIIEISSSMIREGIQKGKKYNHLIPLPAWEIIEKNGYYL